MHRVRGGRWLLLALAVGLFVALTDLALGPAGSLIGLLLLCPLLGATQLNGARTAAVSAYALLLAGVLAALEWRAAGTDGTLRVAFLALVMAGAYATWSAHRRARADRQLAKVAAVAQRAILRPLSARFGGVGVCARYRSAARQALIGGDLYAFANTPAGLRLLIGDVRGKGLDAAHLAAATIGAFRDCAYTTPDLPAVVHTTDHRLGGELAAEDFVTALVAEVAPGRVRLANCGHHPPLHLPAAGPPALLAPPEPTTPLGLDPAPAVQEFKLAPGDRLLFYTDGLAEARNPHGTMLDMARLPQVCGQGRLDDATDAVMDALTRHTGGELCDDIALVLIEIDPNPARQRRHRTGTACRRVPRRGG